MASENNFKGAKDLYLDNIKVTPANKDKPKTKTKAKESKYARAARLGLCFHCFYEGTKDLNKRPAGKADGFCKVCMDQMDIQSEGITESTPT